MITRIIFEVNALPMIHDTFCPISFLRTELCLSPILQPVEEAYS